MTQTHYFDMVYDVVRLIPPGRVTTYGAISDYLALGSARMVGWALNQCHTIRPDVPAHRVVNRFGELSGRLHFESPTHMQELLAQEGVLVDEDKIVNFDRLVWHPREIDEAL